MTITEFFDTIRDLKSGKLSPVDQAAKLEALAQELLDAAEQLKRNPLYQAPTGFGDRVTLERVGPDTQKAAP